MNLEELVQRLVEVMQVEGPKKKVYLRDSEWDEWPEARDVYVHEDGVSIVY